MKRLILTTAILLIGVATEASETNRLAQAPYMTEVTDSGILVLLSTNSNSYAILLRVDHQWTFYQASVTNGQSVAAYLGKPMRITARVIPKLDVVEGRMFQIVKIEQEDAEPSVAPLPRAPHTGHSGEER